MGVHDRIFKELLRAFLADLIRLVAPELAQRFRFAEATFHDRERFIAWPKGERREVDLLAEVPVVGRAEERVVIHAEVEARARRATAHRLLRYAQLLGPEFDRPVLSVLVNLRGGRGGAAWREVAEEVLGQPVLRFRFLEFGLAKCRAEEYLARPEPLAWVLSALMRRERLSPAEHKVRCLKRLAAADLTGKQQLILGRCVDAYLDLHGEDQRQFEELGSRKENQEVEAMAMTLLQRTEAQALKKGRLEGRREGRREGEVRLLLGQLERKFGPLPEAVRQRVSAADSERLLRWGEGLLAAERLDELFER
jgi:Domain of unknown function (DUF4351)